MYTKLITPKFSSEMKAEEIIMLSVPLLLLLYTLYVILFVMYDNTHHLSQITNI